MADLVQLMQECVKLKMFMFLLSDPQGHFAEFDNIQFLTIIIIIKKYYVIDTLMFKTRVITNFN